jgi:hypothetical protein
MPASANRLKRVVKVDLKFTDPDFLSAAASLIALDVSHKMAHETLIEKDK